MRYAIVHGSASKVQPYLPTFYKALPVLEGGALGRSEQGVCLVYGEDHMGWTLDKYVLPRLASGLYFGKEVFLGDPQPDSATCPTCEGNELDGEEVEIIGNEAIQHMTCLTCPSSWDDIYKFDSRSVVFYDYDQEPTDPNERR